MSMLKPIASASLAEIAFSNLVEAISAGEFEPGQRLLKRTWRDGSASAAVRSAKPCSGSKAVWSLGARGSASTSSNCPPTPSANCS